MPIKLSINVSGVREADKFFKDFKDILKKSDDAARGALANCLKNEVRKRYRTASFPTTDGTRETYEQGKGAGSKPGRRMWRSATSLQRSGQLSKSVVHKKYGKSWKVLIDPGARYGGDPADAARRLRVARIAAQMENPQPYTLRVTKSMLNYLKVLQKGQAGSRATNRDSTTKSQDLTGRTIVVTPTPRPIWQPVADDVMRHIGKYIKPLELQLHRYIRRYTR